MHLAGMNAARRYRHHLVEARPVLIEEQAVLQLGRIKVLAADVVVAPRRRRIKAVFEPSYTSKAEGMGMGLSIARTITEVHHGPISAKNRDHGGASFRIRLPLCNDGAGPS
jgi:nitrogen fixation/metabolism regulation signal transduction histidine kinase